MNASPSHAARLPGPRDFTWPLTVPGGEMAGAEVVRELPAQVALPVWQALRSVLLWAAEPEASRAGLFEEEAMRAWELELLEGTLENTLRDPLAVIVDELATPGEASEPDLAWSCMCIANWCLDRRAVSTALAFAEACALCWPEHARYAWFAGRLLRRHGRLKEAEQWMRRAVRLAASTGDFETQTLGMNSLGNILHEQGRYGDSRQTLQNALRLARKFQLPQRQGEVLHDLLVSSHALGDLAQAEEYGREALDFYKDGHERLPLLAHDVAWLWVSRGQHHRALTLLRELLPYVTDSRERLRVVASACQAAGACSENELFLSLWSQFQSLAATRTSDEGLASAFITVGYGAAYLSEREIAATAIRSGLEIAKRRAEYDAVARGESLLDQLADRRRGDAIFDVLGTRPSPRRDPLTIAFVTSLRGSAQVVAA